MNERSRRFREVISAFIDERWETKLKGVKEEKRADTLAKYEYPVWLADAARRVAQIQAVTHVLKATHPDARGTSLHVLSDHLPAHNEVGSHSLEQSADDVVGNAAALDVYKFLKLEVDGRPLLDWFQSDDEDLLAALSESTETAKEWAEAFKGLIRTPDQLRSHQMAKQLYWCVTDEPADDTGFHLLQPLFSSSFAHAVHQEIQNVRFGEDNKEARQARRDNKPHEMPYRNYHELAVRKLGGTKPQNISQLNSERGGVNYLLASFPPRWNRNRPKQFLFIDSALTRFRYYEGVVELLDELLTLLKSDPDSVMETRIKREGIERALGQSLAAFGLEVKETFEPGWSRDENCKLPLCEQLWLDSERTKLSIRESHAEADRAFIEAYEWKGWPDEVAHRFGNWLNAILRDQDLPVSEVEHAHWAKQAIVEADWPAAMQRRAVTSEGEVEHG